MFKRADQLNGLDAWMCLIRHINRGRSLWLDSLWREMKKLHLKAMKSLADVEHSVAEFENCIQECIMAAVMAPSAREVKDDMLAILPEKLQTDLLWHASDRSISFLSSETSL